MSTQSAPWLLNRRFCCFPFNPVLGDIDLNNTKASLKEIKKERELPAESLEQLVRMNDTALMFPPSPMPPPPSMLPPPSMFPPPSTSPPPSTLLPPSMLPPLSMLLLPSMLPPPPLGDNFEFVHIDSRGRTRQTKRQHPNRGSHLGQRAKLTAKVI